MYLSLLCEVEIGNIITRSVHQGEIKSSFKNLTDTCELVLPRNLVFKNENLLKIIKVGDPVTVKMSVNGTWTTEFEGYVREIDSTIPVHIMCEDEMWNLKRTPVVAKSWSKAYVADVIDHILPAGVESKIFDGKSTTVSIGKFMINNMSAAQVLNKLREYGIFSYFRNKVLHVGFAYDYTFDTHVLHFQKNIRSNDLKFRSKDDYKIQVKAIANLPTGQKTIEYYPDKDTSDQFELRTLNFGELSSDITERKKLLRQYAEAEIKRFNVDGYRGRVSVWGGVHNIKHGDLVILKDGFYPERESTNLVDEVVTSWGEIYFKRECEIGPRV